MISYILVVYIQIKNCQSISYRVKASIKILPLIKDELKFETNVRQNLVTFCQTYMEDEADQLINLSLSKNAIDKTEYPKVIEIENGMANSNISISKRLGEYNDN